MATTIRAHLSLRKDLIEELDARVGARKRSEAVNEILEEYLHRQRFLEVINRFTGSISAEDHPEWATTEDINNWVRESRRSDWERDIEPRND